MISARHLVCFILFSPLASGSLLRDDDVPLKKATGGVLPAGRSLGKDKNDYKHDNLKGVKLAEHVNPTQLPRTSSPPPVSSEAKTLSAEEKCRSVLDVLAYLLPGDRICSSDGTHTFGLSNDGDLGIWHGPTQIWSAGTCCNHSNVSARLQRDGNFVVRHDGGVLWSSRTQGSTSNAKVSLRNDGVVTILNKDNGKILTINPSVKEQVTSATLPIISETNSCMDQTSGRLVFELGKFVCSPNRRFFFGVDAKGNLGLFEGAQEIWSLGSCCAEDNVFAVLQMDGNFVVRNSRKDILWSTRTSHDLDGDSSISLSDTGIVAVVSPEGRRIWAVAPNPSKSLCRTQLDGRFTLKEGEFICSENAQFRFGVFEGDLSLWDYNRLRWSAGTCCSSDGVQMTLQYNGKLVVNNSNKQELWFTDTGGNGASLRLGNDGIPQVVSSSGDVLWTVDPSPSPLLLQSSSPTTDPSPAPSTAPSPVPSPSPSLLQSSSPIAEPSPSPSTASPSLLQSSSPTTDPSPAPSTAPSPVPSPSPSLQQSSSPTAEPSTSPSTAPSPVPSLSPSLLQSSSPTEKSTRCVPSTPGRTRLQVGDFVCSPNGQYKFGMSFDGKLVFLDGSHAVWKAEKSGSRTTLQLDGNLVLRDFDDLPLWSSKTAYSKKGSASLVVGDDGVAAVHCLYRGYVWSTAVELNGRVVPESLYNKVMAGYQGWFHAKGDGGWDRWVHWSIPLTLPTNDTVTIDMWPDVSELDDDELFPTNFSFADGSAARVYSSYKRKTVERHCRWMQDYNIDGVFLQRFIGAAVKHPTIVDQVLSNVRSGSEKYGRVFAIMYDISNGDEDTLVEDVINDWKRLADEQFVTASSQYLHHRGRPLLSIWGLGFHDRVANYFHAVEILDWFQYEAEEKYKVTLMGGVPAGWRDLSGDSKTHLEWMNVYRRFDVISPWTVGRMHEETADSFLKQHIVPDMQECESARIDYLPVVFPGFSAFHLVGKPLNEIPRLGGKFLWHQVYNALTAGNSMIYIAMFDEVDEGTAIFKVAATQEDAPVEAPFLTLDADGDNLPNDWYLRLAGETAKYLHEGIDCPAIIPISP